MRYSAAQRAAAEAAGTFIFVFAGAAAVTVNEWTGGLLGLPGVAGVHGLALAAAVSALRPISGGHVNPALSIACAAARQMPWRSTVVYVLAQLAGGVVAALAVTAVFPAGVWEGARLGAVGLHPDVTWFQGLLMEAILAFALVTAYLGAASDPRGLRAVTGIVVGGAAAVAMMVGGPITGGAINPARAFAVALAGGAWRNQLLFWLGPAAGAVGAGLFYDRVLRPLFEAEGERAESKAEAGDGVAGYAGYDVGSDTAGDVRGTARYDRGGDAKYDTEYYAEDDVETGKPPPGRRRAAAFDLFGDATAGKHPVSGDKDVRRSMRRRDELRERYRAEEGRFVPSAERGEQFRNPEPGAALADDGPSGVHRGPDSVLPRSESPGRRTDEGPRGGGRVESEDDVAEPLQGKNFRERVRELRRQLELERLENRRKNRGIEQDSEMRSPWRRLRRPPR